MNLNIWMPYLIAVNSLGFALQGASRLLDSDSPEPLVLGIAFLGGAPGVVLAAVLFRGTPMVRILWLTCLALIQAAFLA